MAAWVIPVVMAIAGALSKKSEADAANKPKTSTYNKTDWMEPMDHYNWAYTPEQNQEQNMGNVFYGQLASMMQNLIRKDLGGFLNDFGAGSGGGGPDGRKQFQQGPDRRDTYSA